MFIIALCITLGGALPHWISNCFFGKTENPPVVKTGNNGEGGGKGENKDGTDETVEPPSTEEEELPVTKRLSEINVFHGNGELVEGGSFTCVDADNLGNYVYSAMASKRNIEEADHVTYVLNGKYKSLSFRAGLADLYKDEEYPVWYEVWADGRKIGETARFRKGVYPGTYRFDITGAVEITIRIEGDTYTQMVAGDFWLES